MSTTFPYKTVAEAAVIVGVTPARIKQLIVSMDLPVLRPHQKVILIPDAQVKRLKRLPRTGNGRPRKSDKRA